MGSASGSPVYTCGTARPMLRKERSLLTGVAPPRADRDGGGGAFGSIGSMDGAHAAGARSGGITGGAAGGAAGVGSAGGETAS